MLAPSPTASMSDKWILHWRFSLRSSYSSAAEPRPASFASHAMELLRLARLEGGLEWCFYTTGRSKVSQRTRNRRKAPQRTRSPSPKPSWHHTNEFERRNRSQPSSTDRPRTNTLLRGRVFWVDHDVAALVACFLFSGDRFIMVFGSTSLTAVVRIWLIFFALLIFTFVFFLAANQESNISAVPLRTPGPHYMSLRPASAEQGDYRRLEIACERDCWICACLILGWPAEATECRLLLVNQCRLLNAGWPIQ